MEYSRILEILKASGMEIKVGKEVLNNQIFKAIGAKQPKMIHVSCNGFYDKLDKEFMISFE